MSRSFSNRVSHSSWSSLIWFIFVTFSLRRMALYRRQKKNRKGEKKIKIPNRWDNGRKTDELTGNPCNWFAGCLIYQLTYVAGRSVSINLSCRSALPALSIKNLIRLCCGSWLNSAVNVCRFTSHTFIRLSDQIKSQTICWHFPLLKLSSFMLSHWRVKQTY